MDRHHVFNLAKADRVLGLDLVGFSEVDGVVEVIGSNSLIPFEAVTLCQALGKLLEGQKTDTSPGFSGSFCGAELCLCPRLRFG